MTILTPSSPVPVRYWKCPSCGRTAAVQRDGLYTEFHECPKFGNASIPMVEVSQPDATPDARHVAVQREDGPSMASIRTERGDGSNDVHVFAPTATEEGT